MRVKARRSRTSDRGTKLIVHEVEPFDGDGVRPAARACSSIDATASALVNGRARRSFKTIARSAIPGRDVVELHVVDERRTTTLRLPRCRSAWTRDANGLHAELMELFGADAVRERR